MHITTVKENVDQDSESVQSYSKSKRTVLFSVKISNQFYTVAADILTDVSFVMLL